MTGRKWTPGPWDVMRYSAGDAVPGFEWYLFSHSYGAVGYWTGGKDNHKDERWLLTEHDAHLIAAAPELYDALIGAENALRQYGMPPEYYRRHASNARAALAKARGET